MLSRGNSNWAARDSHNSRLAKTLVCLALFCIALAFSFPPLLASGAYSSTSPPPGIGLTLTARPPILPADGGSYPSIVLEFKNLTSGMPFIPQANLNVLMSSSNPQIGTAPSTVVFPAGSLYVTVPFITTMIAGGTTLNAYFAGYQPGSLTVTTLKLGGMPTNLNVFLAPSTIPANKTMNANVIVEVTDSFGNPVKLAHPLTVTLSSSNSQLGTLSTSSLLLPASAVFATATFTPSNYVSGQTIIAASANGYALASSVMTTIGSTPRKLVVTVAPSIIWANPAESATITVQLQDNTTNTPVYAPAPVNVTLTSNNNASLPVPSPFVVIPAGSSYTTVSVHPGGPCSSSTGLCSATITAAAQGYLKGSAVAQTTSRSTTPATNVLITFALPVLLPDRGTYSGVVVVELVSFNATLNLYVPATLASSQTIYARSSYNATMQVSGLPANVPAGATHVNFSVTSGSLPGTVAITAQSKGLTPDTESLSSVGLRPNALMVQTLPNVLPADGNKYASIIVSSIDFASKTPAKVPVNTQVTLAIAPGGLGQLEASTVTIPANHTFVIASFIAPTVSGTAEIIATALNYTTATGNLTFVSSLATNLGVYAAPSVVLAGGQSYQNLIVQLQNPSGIPVETNVPGGVTVLLSTQATTSGIVPPQVTIPQGASFALVRFGSTSTPGIVNITAFATGFQAGLGQVQTMYLPMKVQIQIYALTLSSGGATNMSILVTASQAPLLNASVSWTATSGAFSRMVNMTNSSGIATAMFKAGTSSAAIQVQVSKLGYQTYLANATVVMTIPGQGGGGGNGKQAGGNILTQLFFGLPLWMLLAIVGAVVIVAVVVVKKARGGEYEE